MRQGAKSKQMCVLKAMFGMFYGWAAIKYATNSFLCYFLWLCKRKESNQRNANGYFAICGGVKISKFFHATKVIIFCLISKFLTKNAHIYCIY